MSQRHDEMAEFYRVSDSHTLAPSNFIANNPEVLARHPRPLLICCVAKRTGSPTDGGRKTAVHGVATFQVCETVAITPRNVVQHGSAEIMKYEPTIGRIHLEPAVIVAA